MHSQIQSSCSGPMKENSRRHARSLYTPLSVRCVRRSLFTSTAIYYLSADSFMGIKNCVSSRREWKKIRIKYPRETYGGI